MGNLFVNEYNRAMDFRNGIKSSLNTIRAISIGSIITLITAIFTQIIVYSWIYFLIPTILVSIIIIVFILIQTRLSSRLDKIDNYCKYIQVKLRDLRNSSLKSNDIEINDESSNNFIPFSFTFDYIKKRKELLLDSLDRFNKANVEDYLKAKLRKYTLNIPLLQIIGLTLAIIAILITIIAIGPTILGQYQGDTIVQIIISLTGAIVGGLVGIIFYIIKQRLRKKSRGF